MLLIWVSKSMDKLATAITLIPCALAGLALRASSIAKRMVQAEQTFGPERSIRAHNAQPVQAAGQPVISVDTKKKELVGDYKNGGTDYRPKGDPQRVNVHDFADKELGKAIPYGVYDVAANAGFVSVGITSDTAEFAVEAIRSWLDRMGRSAIPGRAS